MKGKTGIKNGWYNSPNEGRQIHTMAFTKTGKETQTTVITSIRQANQKQGIENINRLAKKNNTVTSETQPVFNLKNLLTKTLLLTH